MKLEKLDTRVPDGYWTVCEGELLYCSDGDASKLTIRSLSTGNTSSYKTECEETNAVVFFFGKQLHMVNNNDNVCHVTALGFDERTNSFTVIKRTDCGHIGSDLDYCSRSTMYFPSRKQLFSLTNHCTYAIPETGEFITCFEHGSRIYYLTNLGSTTFLKSVHLQDKTQETCNKISDSCGAPITFGRANDSFVFGENIFIFFGDWKVLRLNMRDRSIEDATKLVEELSGMDYLWSAQDDQAIYFEVSDNDENSSLWKLPICSEEPVSNSVIIANRDYLKCSACNGLVDKQKAFRCRTCIANNVMSAKIIFCGTCFTLQHNGHVFNNEEIVDNSTKLASLTSLGLSVVDMETLKTTLRQSLSEVIDLEITRNLETLEEKVELIEISKKRIQDDRSMTASDLQWNMEAIRELSSAADQELERIEMWKDRVLSAILASNSE
ncbi:hypothetical protein QR680_004257 [Steinernema hermaphroditum]|uniref:Uncharacterized protein n=1 Tax=Steinernema hermaphroditum TaxID=289476 RepID=A0AA39HN44_9BILA|nr:hypothetical protein QR680_004257 [Steinernema hermaphroditum]